MFPFDDVIMMSNPMRSNPNDLNNRYTAYIGGIRAIL